LASSWGKCSIIEDPRGAELLRGLLAAGDRDEMARFGEILVSRFLWGRVEASRLRVSPEDESWVAGLPAGVLRDATARLRELADPAYPGPRPEGASLEVAARALLELFALLGEAAA
jgi:hypothetical protein